MNLNISSKTHTSLAAYRPPPLNPHSYLDELKAIALKSRAKQKPNKYNNNNSSSSSRKKNNLMTTKSCARYSSNAQFYLPFIRHYSWGSGYLRFIWPLIRAQWVRTEQNKSQKPASERTNKQACERELSWASFTKYLFMRKTILTMYGRNFISCFPKYLV